MAGGDEAVELDGLTFVWSRTNAKVNRRKHGVTFEEATTVFADPLAKVREDRSGAHEEHRMQIMGYSLYRATSSRRSR